MRALISNGLVTIEANNSPTGTFGHYRKLVQFLESTGLNPLTSKNQIKILKNGEQKVPEILASIKKAKHHIHIEYYIIEDDHTGREFEKALVEKVKEGIIVRLIYDDFGCRAIRKTWLRRISDAGVEIIPFNKSVNIAYTNKLNYRNHRKMVIVDGRVGFVGGMNICDRYINGYDYNDIYWRDTHMRIEGESVSSLQYLFFSDWNYYSNSFIEPNLDYFPKTEVIPGGKIRLLQFAASGPESDYPAILFSILEIIHQAENEILLTTPYLIPCDSLSKALTLAASAGVKVKILIPKQHDSFFIHYASQSFYEDFMRAGIELYLYTKGFVHAKTLVADSKIATLGTANMDYRSFELNYEVNAIVFDTEIAEELRNHFYSDITDAIRLDLSQWTNRNGTMKFLESTARLVSPLL